MAKKSFLDMDRKEREADFERWGQAAFKDHKVECISGDPTADGTVRVFSCSAPDTNVMAFTISFLPYSIHIDGDFGPFSLAVGFRQRYDLHWLIKSVQSRRYVIEKASAFLRKEELVPAEVDKWLKDEETRILEEVAAWHIDDEDRTEEQDLLLEHGSLSAAKEYAEHLEALKEEWASIKWKSDEVPIEMTGHQWKAAVYDITHEWEGLDRWDGWQEKTHIFYQLLKAFVRAYRRGYL